MDADHHTVNKSAHNARESHHGEMGAGGAAIFIPRQHSCYDVALM